MDVVFTLQLLSRKRYNPCCHLTCTCTHVTLILVIITEALMSWSPFASVTQTLVEQPVRAIAYVYGAETINTVRSDPTL